MPDSDNQEQQVLAHAFWDRRLAPPRLILLLSNIVNTAYEVMYLVEGYQDRSPHAVVYRVVQVIIVTFVYLSLLPSFFNPRHNWMVRFGFMVGSLKEVLYVYNWEMDPDFEQFRLGINLGLVVSVFFMHLHMANFNNNERGHSIFALVYFNLIVGAIFASAHGFKETLEEMIFLFVTFPATQFAGWYMIKGESLSANIIQQLFDSMQDHKFIKMVLDTFTHPVAIFEEDSKLTYSNPAFKAAFAPLLDRIEAHQASCLLLRVNRRPSMRRSKYNIINRVRSCLAKREAASVQTERKIQFLVEEDEMSKRLNNCPEFFKIEAFRRYSKFNKAGAENESQEKLCFQKLIAEQQESNDQIFEVIKEHLAKPESDEARSKQSSAETPSFVQVKIQDMNQFGLKRTLVQFIDVTDQVLYEQTKEEKQLLSMINATISHELRNPLNSVVSQNYIKEAYLQRLEAQSQSLISRIPPQHKPEAEAMILTIQEINKAAKIQTLAAQMMTFQVQNFLDYAQIKAKKFRVNEKEFNIREAVAKVMSLQADSAAANGIEFTAKFINIAEEPFDNDQKIRKSGAHSPMVCTDEQRLMQVLLNLQSNALKFTRKGSVDITVTLEDYLDGHNGDVHGKWLKVEVVDTGLGVAYADQEKLFKLFGFGQHTSHFNTSGIGLGLVISEKIVNELGGEIGFSSIPSPLEGFGSKFFFKIKVSESLQSSMLGVSSGKAGRASKIFGLNSSTLIYNWKPRQNKDPESEDLSRSMHYDQVTTLSDVMTENEAQATNILERTTPSRILIVDDQIFNIKALQVVLQLKFGIDESRCLTAMDGQEALDLVKKDATEAASIKLILMDCNMPFMDGFESSQKIREYLFESRGQDIKEQLVISAVTGHVEPKHVKKCFEHGMNQVISKPVDQAALRTALESSGILK